MDTGNYMANQMDNLIEQGVQKRNIFEEKLQQLDSILHELQMDEYLNEESLPKVGNARGIVHELLNLY